MLIDLIKSLNKEELRHIKIFLNRTEAGTDRKDIRLIDLIRNSSRANEDKFASKLYPGQDKNAYYRLKHRATEESLKGLSTLYFNHSSAVQAMHVLGLSRHFAEGGKLVLATELLQRARQLSTKDQDYGLLEVIYTDMLHIAMEWPESPWTADEIISSRLANRERITVEQEVDDILSIINSRLVQTNEVATRELLLQGLRQELDNLLFGPRLETMDVLRVRLFKTYRTIIERYSTPEQLEKFLRQSYKSFKKENIFKKRSSLQSDILVKMISLMIRFDKQEKAVKYIDDLHELAKSSNGVEQKELMAAYYTFSHKCMLTTNPLRAFEILQAGLQEKSLKHDFKTQMLFQIPAIRMAHVNKRNEEARTSLTNIRNHRSFIELPAVYRIKIETADLMMRYLQNDLDYIRHFITDTYQLAQGTPELAKQYMFLDILNGLILNNDNRKVKDIEGIGTTEDFETGDILDYNLWMKQVTRAM
jgi:hypothetical protein